VKLDKRHMGVSIVLLVGSVIYNIWVFTGSGTARPTSQPSGPIQALPDGAPAADGGPIDPAQLKPLPDVALDRPPEWSRNPFQNMRAPAEVVAVTGDSVPEPIPDADPVVGTILYSSDRRAAVVDGRIVRIGDMVGTSRVVDILPKAVILDSPEGGRRILEMKRGTGTGSVPGATTGAAPEPALPGGRR